MSFMNVLSAFGGQGGASQASPEQHASIMQSVFQHFGSQPGGLSGVTDQFRQNGMGSHVDSWMNTQPGQQPQQLQPEQVEQGLGQQHVDAIAQHAGVSSGMVKAALAFGLPMLMSHLSQGSGQLPQEATTGGGLSGLAQGLFSRI